LIVNSNAEAVVDGFEAALRDAQQLVEDAALMAVEVLSEIARDPAVPASVRVKASVAILDRL